MIRRHTTRQTTRPHHRTRRRVMSGQGGGNKHHRPHDTGKARLGKGVPKIGNKSHLYYNTRGEFNASTQSAQYRTCTSASLDSAPMASFAAAFATVRQASVKGTASLPLSVAVPAGGSSPSAIRSIVHRRWTAVRFAWGIEGLRGRCRGRGASGLRVHTCTHQDPRESHDQRSRRVQVCDVLVHTWAGSTNKVSSTSGTRDWHRMRRFPSGKATEVGEQC